MQEEETYLVGCDDGLVVRCSTAYDAEYLDAYGDREVDGGHDLEVCLPPLAIAVRQACTP